MISKNEYKILKAIKRQMEVERQDKDYIHDMILVRKIEEFLPKMPTHELNEGLIALKNKELVVNIYTDENKNISGTEVTDLGLCAIKNYKQSRLKNTTKTLLVYLWQVALVVLTVFLTKYLKI